MNDPSTTEPDASEQHRESKIPTYKLCLLSFSIGISYIFNVMRLQDMIIQKTYRNEEFHFTTIIIYLISSASTSAFSLLFNRSKQKNETHFNVFMIFVFFVVNVTHICIRVINFQIIDPVSNELKIFEYCLITIPIFLCFQFLTLKTYIIGIWYAIKYKLAKRRQRSDKEDYYYNLIIEAEANIGLIGLIDGSFRAIPLQIVQIYLFIKDHYTFDSFSTFEQILIFFAFFLIPLSSTSYESSLRKSQESRKKKMGWKSYICHYCWNIGIIVSRTLSIGVFAAFSLIFASTMVVTHCIGWSLWLWYSTPPLQRYDCKNFGHILFCAVIGVIYFCIPIKLKDEPTIRRNTIFYTIMGLENCFGLLMWYKYEEMSIWSNMILLMTIIFYFIGIFAQILYYLEYHPNKATKEENEELIEIVIN